MPSSTEAQLVESPYSLLVTGVSEGGNLRRVRANGQGGKRDFPDIQTLFMGLSPIDTNAPGVL
jgi:hypothetical protein